MSVTESQTDSWIAHLPWTSPRPTVYGPADGIFAGNLGSTGDATGGTVTMTGLLSLDRREDWIYVLGGYSARRSAGSADEVLFTFQSGPLIVSTGASLDRPRYDTITTELAKSGNLVAIGGSQPFLGTPLFGDKRNTGDFELFRVLWNANADLATYQGNLWGFLIRYQSFFRGVPAAVS